MSDLLKDFATEQGHFYDREGNPRYEVPNVSRGGMRPTRVTDARKLALVPSVTTVMKLLDKPGLTNWLIDQAILAALTLPRAEGESEAAWLARVKQDAKETGKKAADRGTAIHGAIENYYRGRSVNPELTSHALSAFSEVQRLTGFGMDGGWLAEKSATSQLGFGCKTDLIRPGWTIDFKSKEFDDTTGLATWDEHAMQLQANSVAHKMPDNRGAIVYVSATVPGLSVAIEVSRADLDRGWAMFCALLDLWRAKNNYDPRF